jgi:Zn-dependent protease
MTILLPLCGAQAERRVEAIVMVAAQLAVAVPLIAWVELFGYSRFQPVNAMLAIWGFFSLSLAVFNLLPIRPLDGSIAWGLLPALFKRSPAPPVRREPGWRSWR